MSWRVGLLIPSSNAVMEVDFYRRFPHDTTLHTSRVWSQDDPLPAARAIADVRPDIVVLGCTQASLQHGKAYDEEIRRKVGEAAGAVAISVTASVTQSLRDTRATRIAMVTPYADDVNQRIKVCIEGEGFQISTMHGMGMTDAEASTVTSEVIYAFVQARIGPRVPGDALYLACTNYQALGALSLLKISYDVPIVTSNLATLQAVKRELDRLRDRNMAKPVHQETSS